MNPKILVVDDESDITHAVCLTLSIFQPTWEVIESHDGYTALTKIVAERPNLVLLDLAMPKMDGFETLHRLRQFSAIPVVIFSAKYEAAYKEKALAYGANAFLPKTADPSVVIKTIQEELDTALHCIPAQRESLLTGWEYNGK